MSFFYSNIVGSGVLDAPLILAPAFMRGVAKIFNFGRGEPFPAAKPPLPPPVGGGGKNL